GHTQLEVATASEIDPFGSSYGPEYWLRRCEGFLAETPTKRIGRIVGIRYGRSQDKPEALAVRAGRFTGKLFLINVADVLRIDPKARRIFLTDPPRLLPE